MLKSKPIFWDKTLDKPDWTCDEDKNPYITCTEGFVPLDVQIAKFEQSGVRAKYRSEMFDSEDMRDMYLGPNTRIYADDDLETINEKLEARENIRRAILLRYQKEQQELLKKQNSESSGNAKASSVANGESVEGTPE